MAGLNFYTQTIINKNEDRDSGKTLFVGNADEGGSLRVLRDFTFYKDKAGFGKTLSVTHKAGHDYKLCKATIDFKKLIESLKDSDNNVPMTLCRLDVYLGVEGAEPYIYSTPWVQKGRPFWIEFVIPADNVASDATGAATAVVAKLVEDIKKVHMFQCDKDLVNVSASGKDLILEGANEYQRFKNIEVVAYNEMSDSERSLCKLGEAGSFVTLNMRGTNGFGTYSQIVKDLRLPTAANFQPYHVRQDETPIIGATYDQFIIEYEAPATNEGLGAVGQRMNSVTTHVFWVNQAGGVASAFGTAVANLVESVTESGLTGMESDEVSDDTDEESALSPHPHVSNDPHPAVKGK